MSIFGSFSHKVFGCQFLRLDKKIKKNKYIYISQWNTFIWKWCLKTISIGSLVEPSWEETAEQGVGRGRQVGDMCVRTSTAKKIQSGHTAEQEGTQCRPSLLGSHSVTYRHGRRPMWWRGTRGAELKINFFVHRKRRRILCFLSWGVFCHPFYGKFIFTMTCHDTRLKPRVWKLRGLQARKRSGRDRYK